MLQALRSRLRPALFQGMARAAGPLAAGDAAIIAYHSVGDAPHPLAVPIAAFRRQIEYLGCHFDVVPLGELVAAGPRPRVALTFDDGYRDNFEAVRPILLRAGLPAAFFITTGLVGGACPLAWGPPALPMMDWPELLALAADGFEIASHTVTHPDLTRTRRPEAIDRELRESRRVLEERLGRAVASFAYPFGRCNAVVRARAAAAGYSMAVTTRRRPLRPRDHPLALPRIEIPRHADLAYFQALLSRAALQAPLLARL